MEEDIMDSYTTYSKPEIMTPEVWYKILTHKWGKQNRE